jgi:hypothetical protein
VSICLQALFSEPSVPLYAASTLGLIASHAISTKTMLRAKNKGRRTNV